MGDVICVSDSENEEIRSIPDFIDPLKIVDVVDVAMTTTTTTTTTTETNPSTSTITISSTSSSTTSLLENVVDSHNNDDDIDSMTNLEEFLDEIENSVKNSEYFDIIRQKTPALRAYYKNYRQQIDAQHLKFLMTVTTAPSDVMSMAQNGLLQFTRLFKKLKNFHHQPHLININKNKKQKLNGISNENDNGQKEEEEQEEEEEKDEDEEIIVETSDVEKLRKIEVAMDAVVRKIRDLETREVDFDNDDDTKNDNQSSYVIMDLYQRRLRKLYDVYCRLLRRDPNAGRATYDRLNFQGSTWPEINQALNRKFRTCHTFPAYCDVERVVRRTVQKHAHLTTEMIDVKRESVKCFKIIGAKIKRKRRKEMHQNLLEEAMYDVDPAQCDVTWDRKLKENYRCAQQKIQDIINKNAAEQDLVGNKMTVDLTDDDDDDEGNDSSSSSSDSCSISSNNTRSAAAAAAAVDGDTVDDDVVQSDVAPSVVGGENLNLEMN